MYLSPEADMTVKSDQIRITVLYAAWQKSQQLYPTGSNLSKRMLGSPSPIGPGASPFSDLSGSIDQIEGDLKEQH
jgi:hypothetical protein